MLLLIEKESDRLGNVSLTRAFELILMDNKCFICAFIEFFLIVNH